MISLSILFFFMYYVSADSKITHCVWESKGGASYDLRPLALKNGAAAYNIKDGDIPCTPEIEPTYGYAWNFCDVLPSDQTPQPCKLMNKNDAVVQYAQYSATEYYCYVLGRYDSSRELTYNFLDAKDPTKGVSVRYPSGDKCSATNTKLRSATIDVQCANVEHLIVSAQEPDVCDYHLVMKSYYGCPKECPITSNGLCDSHGHCAYDSHAKQAYCYCNEGYGGSACSSKSSSSSSSSSSTSAFSVQIGFLVTLLVAALALTGVIIYLSFQITEFRKNEVENHYKALSGGENEMVTTLSFR